MWKILIYTTLLLTLTGCADFAYYLHSTTGHLQVLSKRQAISDLLQNPATPTELRNRLQQITDIRSFASNRLLLPKNGSYSSYVELNQPYVVWNVVATPEFSLQPQQWCFPVVGCVSYRGYFDQASAENYAASLDGENFDTAVVGVPAYSTLSWFDDPILSTFSNWPTPAIAKLIFHELAHQKLYLPGDSTFNESFATAVERIGIEIWLKKQNNPQLTNQYRQQRQHQQQFHALLQTTRNMLEKLYKSDISTNNMLQRKQLIFDNMYQDYQLLRNSWGGYSGYDNWFKTVNNARFASINTYHRWVPAFLQTMQQEDDSLNAFYQRCQTIAKLPKTQRHQLLNQLVSEYQSTDNTQLAARE